MALVAILVAFAWVSYSQKAYLYVLTKFLFELS